MKKFFSSKIVLTLFAIAIIVGAWATWYVFFKPHRDYGNEKPAFTLSAEQFYQEFKTNAETANKKYLDKAVLLDGTISEVSETGVELPNVSCTVDSSQISKLVSLKVGDKVKIQGQVVGYNELTEGVDVSKCYIK